MTQPPIVPGPPPDEPQWYQPPASPPPYQAPYAPPPAQQYQQPYGYDPNQHIQVIAKPGGLSGAAHAVHILICFFTCGLWLIGYAIFIATAPNQRFEVIAPYGADPQLVARARLEAEARSKVPPSRARAQEATHALPSQPLSRRGMLLAITLIGGFVAFVVVAAILVG